MNEIIFDTKNDYILEKDVGNFLSKLYPEVEIVHNKKHKKLSFRPDYWIPSENLIVEFDGPIHYNSNKVVVKDIINNQIAKENNIKLIRIPYFLQLDRRIILYKFSKYTNDYNNYPHGFVSKSVVLPGEFSSLGITRFYEEILDLYKNIDKGEKVVIPIYYSLISKILIERKSYFECFPFVDVKIQERIIREIYHSILYWMEEGKEANKTIASIFKIMKSEIPFVFKNNEDKSRLLKTIKGCEKQS